MICTTNCSWALTLKMVNGLVNNLGRESNDGRKSFPNAETMAAMPLKFFVDEVRAGYRAPYLKELADRVASGELNVEEWLSSELPTRDLLKQMKGVKGVGDYAAENLLKLLGRYDGLALDSWTRAQIFRAPKQRQESERQEDRALLLRDSTSGAGSRSGATSREIGYSHKKAQKAQKIIKSK